MHDAQGTPLKPGDRVKALITGTVRGGRHPGEGAPIIVVTDGATPGLAGEVVFLRPDQVQRVEEQP